MVRRRTAVVFVALLAVSAACSSSHPSTPSTNAPDVSGATDLSAAPTISPGVGAPPKQLVIKDLVVGTGVFASANSTVNVQYEGATYYDGNVFDSSWQRGQPTSFSLAQVIAGFGKGVAGMRVGGRREIVVPPALGYGPRGSGTILPNETLVFVVDLLSVQ